MLPLDGILVTDLTQNVFDRGGRLLARGHNRRVQTGDPSVHGETDAFRNAAEELSRRRDGHDARAVLVLRSPECIEMLAGYIEAHPEIWHEDIGEE